MLLKHHRKEEAFIFTFVKNWTLSALTGLTWNHCRRKPLQSFQIPSDVWLPYTWAVIWSFIKLTSFPKCEESKLRCTTNCMAEANNSSSTSLEGCIYSCFLSLGIHVLLSKGLILVVIHHLLLPLCKPFCEPHSIGKLWGLTHRQNQCHCLLQNTPFQSVHWPHCVAIERNRNNSRNV